MRPLAKVAATEVRACKHCCDRWELLAREGGEGASAWGDAGVRREVPFVAFSQFGKFLQGGKFLQVLEPKVNQELAGRFVEEGASGVVLVAGGGDELALQQGAKHAQGLPRGGWRESRGRRRAACQRRWPASAR